MAESLPRYQKPGVLLGEVPRYDYAHTKEAVRGSAQLYDSLNRLSEWAFRDAAEEAKDRGEQYGAENPVTTQQLLDGTASFADKSSIFGKAARGIQLDTVTTELGIEAENKLVGIRSRAKAGEIDVVGALAEIKDMQDGYSSALAGVDPKASNRFRAHIATSGNSILQSIQEDAGKAATARQKVSVDDWIDNVLPSMVQAHIDAGDSRDPETGNTVTPAMRIQTAKNTLRGAIAAIGDPEFGRQASKRFDEIVTRAQVNAVTQFAVSDEFIRGDPAAALNRLRSGDIGRYSSTYKALPEDQREKVRTNAMQEIGRVHTLAERKEKDAEQARKDEVYGLMTQYWQLPEGKQKQAMKAEIVSKGRGVITFDQLKSLLKPEGGEKKENVGLEIRAENLIDYSGVTDLAEIDKRVPGLSDKQKGRLRDRLATEGKARLSRGIRVLAGIPEGFVNPSGAEKTRWLALTDAAERIKNEAITKDGRFDPDVVLGQLRAQRETLTKDTRREQATSNLATYAAKGGIPKIDENTSADDLRKVMKPGLLGMGRTRVYSEAAIEEIMKEVRTLRGD